MNTDILQEEVAHKQKEVRAAEARLREAESELGRLLKEQEDREDIHPRSTPEWQAINALADVVSGGEFPAKRIASDLKKTGLSVETLEWLLDRKVIPVAYTRVFEPGPFDIYDKSTIDAMYDYDGASFRPLRWWARWRTGDMWEDVKKELTKM